MAPYRDAEFMSTLACPRCAEQLPSGDFATCFAGCGVWVAHVVVADAFDARELAPSRVTSWFRDLVPCPECATRMSLVGYDMSLFQGCGTHGYWVDAPTVGLTGLGRRPIASRIEQARVRAERARQDAIDRERDAREQAERAVAEHHERERATATARAVAAERDREAARIAREAREAAVAPYLELLRSGSELRLAEHLARIDRELAELKRRLDR